MNKYIMRFVDKMIELINREDWDSIDESMGEYVILRLKEQAKKFDSGEKDMENKQNTEQLKKIEEVLARFSMKDGAFLSAWNEKTGEYTVSFEGGDLLEELKPHLISSDEIKREAYILGYKAGWGDDVVYKTNGELEEEAKESFDNNKSLLGLTQSKEGED